MLLQIARRLKGVLTAFPGDRHQASEVALVDLGFSPEHGEIFEGACKDTTTAWGQTSISKMMKPEQLERLRIVMHTGGPEEISDFLSHMMQNPYSSLSMARGFDDAKLVSMAKLMIRAFSQPFVELREGGCAIDLRGMRDSLKKWVVSGELPRGQSRTSDIGKITDLVCNPEQRSVLAAGFGPAIQFSILALSIKGNSP